LSRGDDTVYAVLRGHDPDRNLTTFSRITSEVYHKIENFIDDNTPDTVNLIPLDVKTESTDKPIYAGVENQTIDISYLLHNYSSATWNGSVEVEVYLLKDGTNVHLQTHTLDYGYDLGSKETTQRRIPSIGPIVLPDDLKAGGEYFIGVIVDGNPTHAQDLATLTVEAYSFAYSVYSNDVELINGDQDPSVLKNTEFETMVEGDEPLRHEFTIQNDGDEVLQITKIEAPQGFYSHYGWYSSLEPGEATSFGISMWARTSGTHCGDVVVWTNDGTFLFEVTGTVLARPKMSLFGDVQFGSTSLGGAGVYHEFTVRNDGGSLLELGTITLPDGFTVTQDLPESVMVGDWDIFTIRLDSTALGDKSGQVVITSNIGSEFRFSVYGSVFESVSTTMVWGNGLRILSGDRTPSHEDLTDFGYVSQRGSPVSHTFTVKNNSGEELEDWSVTVPAGYTSTDGIGIARSEELPSRGGGTYTRYYTSLKAGESDTFTIQLDTEETGKKEGNVYVSPQGGASLYYQITGGVGLQDITVLGNGVPITNGDSTPSQADFTDFSGNPSSIQRAFTVRNDGHMTLALGEITVPEGFILLRGLPTSLSPGQEYGFVVGLDNTIPGSRTGDILIANDDPDESPFRFRVTFLAPEITLLGNGIEIIDEDYTPSMADGTDFGIMNVGDDDIDLTFTVRNDGDYLLKNLGLSDTPGLIDGLSESLEAGATDTFTIRINAEEWVQSRRYYLNVRIYSNDMMNLTTISG